MGLGLAELEDGQVDLHVHSHEEGFYVLDGEPVLYLDGRGVRLRPGACGVIRSVSSMLGAQAAWRAGSTCARHARAMADQPADSFVLGRHPRASPAA